MFLEKRVYQGSSGRVYPLPFTDRILERPVPRPWQVIGIENDFLRVLILPELGGRVYAMVDRTTGYDLIYRQPVIKPALVGLAGPWISGGIEFNWPQHHRPATFLPVETAIQPHADGSVTVWCSDHDPMARMKGMHGICLHPERACVELKVRAYNRTALVQTFLWWANVATRVHEGYQSFFPPDVSYVADHALRSMSSYPLAHGRYYGVDYGTRARRGIPDEEAPTCYRPPHVVARAATGESSTTSTEPRLPDYAPNDLSFYANIPVPTSYMCMDSQEDFFGGYDHKAGTGLVHVASHHLAPGKKQWTWGNHEFGYAWDRNLTDPDEHGECAPYIEIMAGVYTDNQPDFSFLQPGETKTWSQYWYPIQQIGAPQHANLDAAVSLRVQAAGSSRVARIGVAVTREFPAATLRVFIRDTPRLDERRDLRPGEPLRVEVPLASSVAETDVRLTVLTSGGGEIITYQPRPHRPKAVPEPAKAPPAPDQVASVDELFLIGVHLEQYRHATRCPTAYWLEGLRRDPGDARCHNAMGLWHLRRGEFGPAEAHFRDALARLTTRNANPCDGEPSYNLGLVLRYQADAVATVAAAPVSGRRASDLLKAAYASFYKATWNQAWAGAAWHALAELDCRSAHWTRALKHVDASLRLGADNLGARDLKAMVLRKLGHDAASDALLQQTLELDPLDVWARFLQEGQVPTDLQACLDLAHDYARLGAYRDALTVLEKGLEACQSGAGPLLRTENAPGSRTEMGAQDLELRMKPSRSADFSPQEATPAKGRPGGPKPALGNGSKPRGMAASPGDLPTQSWGAVPLAHYTRGWLWLMLASSPERSTREAAGSDSTPGRRKPTRHESLQRARACFAAGEASIPDYCFPARLEEIAVLQAALAVHARDARAAYYLGNLLFDRRRHEEALQSWERSTALDPSFPVVWRNLGIGYFNVRRQPERARAAYNKAFKAGPDDARVLYERDQLWRRLGVAPARRLRELEAHMALVAQRDDLSLELCALYNQTGRAREALALLRSRHFQPWEGGEGGPLGQHVRSHVALGRLALDSGDASLAREHFELALTAPPNLGEARHLLANQSDVHYWLGCAWSALGETTEARRHWRNAATFRGDFQEMRVRAFSEMTYYSALSWRALGKERQARQLCRALLEHAKKLQTETAEIDYFATSLPAMLLFHEDLQQRQETRALFLQAQAEAGLGRRRRALGLLNRVLARDPNHAPAADFLASLRTS